MISAGPSSSSTAFATADAGSEYLATAEHYRYLAKIIVDALRRHCLVLLTGDPPASPALLATALGEAAAPRVVIERRCGPDLDCRELFASAPAGPDEPVPVGEEPDGEEPDSGEPGHSAPSSPIFVCADADRLSGDQIAEFDEAALAEPGAHVAGVLLARADFVTRCESAEPPLLAEGLAAHLRVQQLERDEVEAFIRRQLPPGEAADLFTAQRVALIALTSGGDPAVVNRLARRMLQNEPVVLPPSRLPRRRYAVPLRLLTAVTLCLGAVSLVAGPFESRHLDALGGLVRDHIWPRNEPVERPAAAPSPAVDVDGTTAPAPPIAAVADETMPEPAAAGPRLSANEIAALVARGDAFLGTGDIASARLFFERAADGGDGRAAMRMAVTYDAAFLDRAGMRGLRGDPERAAFWYLRARELGNGKASPPPPR